MWSKSRHIECFEQNPKFSFFFNQYCSFRNKVFLFNKTILLLLGTISHAQLWELQRDLVQPFSQDLEVHRDGLAQPDGTVCVVNDLVLGQRVDQDRELSPVLGEPSKGSRKVLDRDPGLEAADDVWAQGDGVDSAAPDLRDNVEVALLDEGLDLGAELACGFEGFGIGLEEVGVEVELFHFLRLGGVEKLGGRQGRGGFGGVHFF